MINYLNNDKKIPQVVPFFLALAVPISSPASPMVLNTSAGTVSDIHITTWKQMRDAQVVKQDLDYSCGASSLSTVLTYFYNTPTSEQQILEDMQLTEMMASFQDLAEVSQKYGFTAKGIATNYDSLKKLKIPAIVYVNHKRSDHFSVVKSINDTHIVLADSSWGNRTLTRKQFEDMWHTRADNNLKGSVLLILPTINNQKLNTNTGFMQVERTQQLLRQSPELFRPFM
ncbi:C39 family peptidase [Psychrobacter phenylpyruvicus]|uniref:ABC-type bacteriocin/lantibiotic exporters, contain an N-terminal double-glycine peptidase domain n=1 Tax=Psychrobacter phenylpyruvicus TaxID=29432 RepID=A0A379LR93_9GAMM|nr:C39 family peptidase [Psychrobacter phenylpyruvicus]SUD92312.1 ABC-type bacteriocin/lantibiotic exporters, contain an N-terminal double-glycine peptidase domain [Psychrobacter phenylpyruvicus]